MGLQCPSISKYANLMQTNKSFKKQWLWALTVVTFVLPLSAAN